VQHGSPDSPQSAHWADVPSVMQTVSGSLHPPPGQHGPSASPHTSQKPAAAHTSFPAADALHEAPRAMQVLGVVVKSQHPDSQASPGQQGWPEVPHELHPVAVHTAVPPEHDAPANTHVCVVGSQQPPAWQGVAPAQQTAPAKPQSLPKAPSSEFDTPPSSETPTPLAQLAAGVPEIDAVSPPCVHVIEQLDPPLVTEHVFPCADRLPQRHTNVPPFSTWQQGDELLEEHPVETATATAKTLEKDRMVPPLRASLVLSPLERRASALDAAQRRPYPLQGQKPRSPRWL
jgi:hypothetical protein